MNTHETYGGDSNPAAMEFECLESTNNQDHQGSEVTAIIEDSHGKTQDNISLLTERERRQATRSRVAALTARHNATLRAHRRRTAAELRNHASS